MMLSKYYKGFRYSLDRPKYRNWAIIKVGLIQAEDKTIEAEWYKWRRKTNDSIWDIQGTNANTVHKLVREHIDQFYSQLQIA